MQATTAEGTSSVRSRGPITIGLVVLAVVAGALSGAASSRASESGWTRQFGSSASDYAEAVAVDGSAVYVTGYTTGALPGQTSAGDSDVFVSRYDTAGNLVWTRQFGTSGEDVAHGVAADGGGVVVTGRASGALPGQSASGDWDAFVRRYDSAGNVVWTDQFGSSAKEVTYSAAVDGSDIYVVGWTRGALPGQIYLGQTDSFLRRYDAVGNVVWTRQFGTGGDDLAHGVAVDGSGVYALSGTTGAFPGQFHAGNYDGVLHRYDTAGNLVWIRQFGTSAQEFDHDLAADGTGVYIAGSTRGALPGQTQSGGLDAFVRRYDSAGNLSWTRQYGTGGDDVALSIEVEGATIHISGWTTGALPGQSSSGGADSYLRQYDTSGLLLSTSQFGGSSDDQALGIDADTAGVYVAGHTHGALPGQVSAGGIDAFVCREDCPDTNAPPSGGTITVEKQTLPDGDPQQFTFAGDIAAVLGDGGQAASSVAPGQYSVTESVPATWTLTSIVCDDGNSTGDLGAATATFNVEPGETVVCTFTNSMLGPSNPGFEWGMPTRLELYAEPGQKVLPPSERSDPIIFEHGDYREDGSVYLPPDLAIDPTVDGGPGWAVSLNACDLADPTATRWQYTFVNRDSGETITQEFGSCEAVLDGLLEATYDVTLVVFDTAGTASLPYTEAITVQDWLIISLGDSVASGEGSPDLVNVREVYLGGGRVLFVPEPVWQDRQCHRSSWAGPAQAAWELEWRDPKTSVTFIHLACSGASILDGVVGDYRGVESSASSWPERVLPAQLDQAAHLTANRAIDAVLLSIGANDLGFGHIAFQCAKPGNCLDGEAIARFENAQRQALLGQLLGQLSTCFVTEGTYSDPTCSVVHPSPDLMPPGDRNESGEAAVLVLPDLGPIFGSSDRLKPVIHTEYFDPAYDDDGDVCNGWESTAKGPLLFFTEDELRYASFEIVDELNLWSGSGWRRTVGMVEAYRGTSIGASGHGLCASAPWVRSLAGALARGNLRGTLHPNESGHHLAYRPAILDSFDGVLTPP